MCVFCKVNSQIRLCGCLEVPKHARQARLKWLYLRGGLKKQGRGGEADSASRRGNWLKMVLKVGCENECLVLIAAKWEIGGFCGGKSFLIVQPRCNAAVCGW